MGMIDLAGFREELHSILGNSGYQNPRLDRWINFGYVDLATAVHLERFSKTEQVNTVPNQNFVEVPDSLGIFTVRNKTTDFQLEWVKKIEFFRLSAAQKGEPRRWTRHENKVLLFPVPEEVYVLEIPLKSEPDPLTAPEDKTTIPAIWDLAVIQLAAHHALMFVGEEERAGAWLERAVTYIQGRVAEFKLDANLEGLGLPKTHIR